MKSPRCRSRGLSLVVNLPLTQRGRKDRGKEDHPCLGPVWRRIPETLTAHLDRDVYRESRAVRYASPRYFVELTSAIVRKASSPSTAQTLPHHPPNTATRGMGSICDTEERGPHRCQIRHELQCPSRSVPGPEAALLSPNVDLSSV